MSMFILAEDKFGKAGCKLRRKLMSVQGSPKMAHVIMNGEAEAEPSPMLNVGHERQALTT